MQFKSGSADARCGKGLGPFPRATPLESGDGSYIFNVDSLFLRLESERCLHNTKP